MFYPTRDLYCHNCGQNLPKAAVRCPWCSSWRVSHTSRRPAIANHIGVARPLSHVRPRAVPSA